MSAEKGAYPFPVSGLTLGTVVRLADGRVGWLYRGRGRNPYRVTCGDVVVNVQADTHVGVVRWPAQLAAEWIAANPAKAEREGQR